MDFDSTLKIPGLARAELGIQTRSVLADLKLRQIARQGKPVVVGPWLSEVGFEVLYWIPLLRWLYHRYPLDPERSAVITRGGGGSWYSQIATRSVEVFDLVEPGQLKAQLEQKVASGGSRKQLEGPLTDLERTLVERAKTQLGTTDAAVIHPALMYNLFAPFWASRRPMTQIKRRTVFAPLTVEKPDSVQDDPPVALPERYFATKVYFSDCLPDTTKNRDFLAKSIGYLTDRLPVVLLTSDGRFDDHVDYLPTDRTNLITVDTHLQPADNLAVQSRIVADSEALFTTYGGFAHLGPMLGVDTYSCYSHDSFNLGHLDVMNYAVRSLRDRGSAVSHTLIPTTAINSLERMAL